MKKRDLPFGLIFIAFMGWIIIFGLPGVIRQDAADLNGTVSKLEMLVNAGRYNESGDTVVFHKVGKGTVTDDDINERLVSSIELAWPYFVKGKAPTDYRTLYSDRDGSIWLGDAGINTTIKKLDRKLPEGLKEVTKYLRSEGFLARVRVQMEKALQVRHEYLAALQIQGSPTAKQGEAPKPNVPEGFEKRADVGTPVLMDKMVTTTSVLRARLSSADLSFTEQETGWKTVTNDVPTVWTWKVSSESSGNKMLIFILEQQIVIDGVEKIVAVESFPYRVTVTASYTEWLWNFPATVLSKLWSNIEAISALVALIGGLMAFRKWVAPFLTRKQKAEAALPIAESSSKATQPPPADRIEG